MDVQIVLYALYVLNVGHGHHAHEPRAVHGKRAALSATEVGTHLIQLYPEQVIAYRLYQKVERADFIPLYGALRKRCDKDEAYVFILSRSLRAASRPFM